LIKIIQSSDRCPEISSFCDKCACTYKHIYTFTLTHTEICDTHVSIPLPNTPLLPSTVRSRVLVRLFRHPPIRSGSRNPRIGPGRLELGLAELRASSISLSNVLSSSFIFIMLVLSTPARPTSLSTLLAGTGRGGGGAPTLAPAIAASSCILSRSLRIVSILIVPFLGFCSCQPFWMLKIRLPTLPTTPSPSMSTPVKPSSDSIIFCVEGRFELEAPFNAGATSSLLRKDFPACDFFWSGAIRQPHTDCDRGLRPCMSASTAAVFVPLQVTGRSMGKTKVAVPGREANTSTINTMTHDRGEIIGHCVLRTNKRFRRGRKLDPARGRLESIYVSQTPNEYNNMEYMIQIF